jgi:hypothetical protein
MIWTRLSFEHAGHVTNIFRSSSYQERPHSQRILNKRCAVAEPSSSS